MKEPNVQWEYKCARCIIYVDIKTCVMQKWNTIKLFPGKNETTYKFASEKNTHTHTHTRVMLEMTENNECIHTWNIDHLNTTTNHLNKFSYLLDWIWFMVGVSRWKSLNLRKHWMNRRNDSNDWSIFVNFMCMCVRRRGASSQHKWENHVRKTTTEASSSNSK